jgi:hypothetical protein
LELRLQQFQYLGSPKFRRRQAERSSQIALSLLL